MAAPDTFGFSVVTKRSCLRVPRSFRSVGSEKEPIHFENALSSNVNLVADQTLKLYSDSAMSKKMIANSIVSVKEVQNLRFHEMSLAA